LVGIAIGTNVFRMGERPVGTDLRSGRNIATRPVVLAGRRPLAPSTGFKQTGDAVDIKAGGRIRDDVGGRVNADNAGGRIKDDTIGGRLRLETLTPAEQKAKQAKEAKEAKKDAAKKPAAKAPPATPVVAPAPKP
jgi:hypothetical protein